MQNLHPSLQLGLESTLGAYTQIASGIIPLARIIFPLLTLLLSLDQFPSSSLLSKDKR